MSRSDPHTAARERKARSIIDFAADLHSQLHDPQSPDLLLADINYQISATTDLAQRLPLRLPSRTVKELERRGRDLWNQCIRLRRSNGSKSAPTPMLGDVLSRARVFAFHVLELGRTVGRSIRDAESDIVYMLGLAMTLGRVCLDGGDLESSRMALEKAAEYVERLNQLPQGDKVSEASRTRLEADYLSVRMVLSWKENSMDVTEHLFHKAESLRQGLDVASAENMADTLRHIGMDYARKHDHAAAIKWHRRSYDIINSQQLDRLSVEGVDTRLAICQGLVQSLLGVGSIDSISEADNLLSCIESEIGDKPIVLHWRLEILQKSPDEVFSAEKFASILRRMTRAFDFTDQTLQFLMHHIKELYGRSHLLAIGLMDELITQRLLGSRNKEWVSKAIIRRIWMTLSEKDISVNGTIWSLVGILDRIQKDNDEDYLNADVTGAAQSKTVESAASRNEYELVDMWCQVALHCSFDSCSEANRSKFQRKRILGAIGLNKAEGAREAFAQMSEATQNEPLTRYLMFKVSLLDWDSELGCQCIEHLTRSFDDGHCQEILYACIREAQQAGDMICALAALKAVAMNWDPVKSPASCLTSIIRASIRLISMLEKDDRRKDSVVQPELFAEDTCRLFELAAARACQNQKDHKGDKIFTVPELNWFRKNAYNIGVTKCDSDQWDMGYIIRIFGACLDFINCYPADLPREDADSLALMAMRCHFVSAAALISLARAEDKQDEKLQRYLEMRKHIADFDTLLESTPASDRPPEIAEDLRRKMSTLSVFDFEAAVALKSWDDLSTIVRRAESYKDEDSLKAMGDCLLRSEAPSRVMFATMRLITNQIFHLEKFDCRKLAKYIRCIFQAILPFDDGLAFQLLKEALEIARQSSGSLSGGFPQAEIEWLVATAFNHSVDFYAREDEEKCHQWALGAMDLASYMDDGGEMRDMLQDKFAKLRFVTK